MIKALKELLEAVLLLVIVLFVPVTLMVKVYNTYQSHKEQITQQNEEARQRLQNYIDKRNERAKMEKSHVIDVKDVEAEEQQKLIEQELDNGYKLVSVTNDKMYFELED